MDFKDDKDRPISKGMEFNPIAFDWIFMAFRMVARLLKESGILKSLEEKAADSKTQLDDKAVRIAKAVLDEMAK